MLLANGQKGSELPFPLALRIGKPVFSSQEFSGGQGITNDLKGEDLILHIPRSSGAAPQPLCPACKRPYPMGKAKCIWCGKDLASAPSPAITYRCPCCESQTLTEYHQGEWEAQVCPACGGAFISTVTMQKLESFYEKGRPRGGAMPGVAARLDASTADASGNLYRQCPQCGQQMARRRYRKISDVVVDECLGHGFWLDPTELERIILFLESGGILRSQAYTESERARQAQFAKDMGWSLRKANPHFGL